MHTRTGDQASCGAKCPSQILLALRKELHARGIPAAHINARPSGCLGRCDNGPILMGFIGLLAEQANPSERLEEELLQQARICFEHVTVDQVQRIIDTLMKLEL